MGYSIDNMKNALRVFGDYMNPKPAGDLVGKWEDINGKFSIETSLTKEALSFVQKIENPDCTLTVEFMLLILSCVRGSAAKRDTKVFKRLFSAAKPNGAKVISDSWREYAQRRWSEGKNSDKGSVVSDIVTELLLLEHIMMFITECFVITKPSQLSVLDRKHDLVWTRSVQEAKAFADSTGSSMLITACEGARKYLRDTFETEQTQREPETAEAEKGTSVEKNIEVPTPKKTQVLATPKPKTTTEDRKSKVDIARKARTGKLMKGLQGKYCPPTTTASTHAASSSGKGVGSTFANASVPISATSQSTMSSKGSLVMSGNGTKASTSRGVVVQTPEPVGWGSSRSAKSRGGWGSKKAAEPWGKPSSKFYGTEARKDPVKLASDVSGDTSFKADGHGPSSAHAAQTQRNNEPDSWGVRLPYIPQAREGRDTSSNAARVADRPTNPGSNSFRQPSQPIESSRAESQREREDSGIVDEPNRKRPRHEGPALGSSFRDMNPIVGMGRGRGRDINRPAWMTSSQNAASVSPSIPIDISAPPPPGVNGEPRAFGNGQGRGRGRGKDINRPAWMTRKSL